MERERDTTEEGVEETGVEDPLSKEEPVERPSEKPGADAEPGEATPERDPDEKA